MHKCLVILMILGIGAISCAKDLQTTKGNSTEEELRIVLCEIKNGNYTDAQNSLEKILQKEPQNIYAQRLLPGVLANQIKKDDQSPENIAQIRKTIEAYQQFLKNPQISTEEKMRANDFIITLYERISEEELLKMAEDTNQTPQIRSKYYTNLAAQFNICAMDISETVKKNVKKGGKDVFVFTKPEKPEDFEKLKQCTAKGMELIEKAIELNPESEMSLSYQVSLLIQKVRIAEMEGNLQEKDRLKKESEAARKKFKILSDKRNKERDQKFEQELSEKKEEIPDYKKYSEELVHYKAENPLENLIKEIYIPDYFYSALVAPVPPAEDQEETELSKDNVNQKHEWKEFSSKKMNLLPSCLIT